MTSTCTTVETFGSTEVTQRDVRYLEQSVFIKDSCAKGPKGLSGATSFQYDANGHLTVLDRGQNQTTKQDAPARRGSAGA